MSSDTLPTTVFILLGLALVVPLVARMDRRAHTGRWSSLVHLAFAVYLVVLIGLLFTPFPLPPWTRLPEESLTGYRPWPFPWVNIVPFETIGGALRYGLDWQPGRVLVGNVLAFVPLGIFLPILSPARRSLISVVGAGLAISLALEAVQLGLSLLIGAPYRVADIDDVIINVLGVALGYGLYRAIGLFLPAAPADPTVQPAG
ncbi:MAG TPA: VanZ family protein [Actinomycetota bacterium]|nr:VanZ family protein [Actinomycetota bacterium]